MQMPKAFWRLLILVRILVGGIFVYSGWNKLSRPVQEFQYMIEQYQTFPTSIAKLVSYSLPWIELCFGTFLIAGFLRKLSAQVLSILTLSFMVLLGSALFRGIPIENCGCFGESIHLSPIQALSFDTFLFLLLLYFSRSSEMSFELDRWLRKNK